MTAIQDAYYIIIDLFKWNCFLQLTSTGSACNGAEPLTLSVKDKEDILKLHNSLRSKVALGQQEGQPIATNMRQLVS